MTVKPPVNQPVSQTTFLALKNLDIGCTVKYNQDARNWTFMIRPQLEDLP